MAFVNISLLIIVFIAGFLISFLGFKTGKEKSIEFAVNGRGPAGKANILIQGLGYINIEEELDFENFSVTSFSSNPVPMRAGLEEFYKLVTSKN